MPQARSPRRCDALVLSQGFTSRLILFSLVCQCWCSVKYYLCCTLLYGLMVFWYVMPNLETLVFWFIMRCGYLRLLSKWWGHDLFPCFISDVISFGADYSCSTWMLLLIIDICLAVDFSKPCAGHNGFLPLLMSFLNE
jgi:hypothetical protein